MRVGDAALQNSTVAMHHITVYYHQSARRSMGDGVLLCYAHHRVLLVISNQRGTDRLRSRRGRGGAVLRISQCDITNFNNQRGVAGSAGDTQEVGGVLCYI
jgi:hypothetical protein